MLVTPLRSSPTNSFALPSPTLPQPPPPPPRLPAPGLKRLSSEELASCRDRGLCFNCDEKYHRGHSRVFFLIADAEDPSLSNINSPEPPLDPPDVSDPTQAQINLHFLVGHLAPKTLCLFGTISGHPIMILIDGGSTHNLIQDSLVAHLGFSSRETRPLRVMVGNGQHLECKRWCEAVTIDIQSTQFTLDLYILPISDANVVLSVQWLKSLGPVLTDYNSLCMKFFYAGQLVELKRDHETISHLLLPPQFNKVLRKQSPGVFYHIVVLRDDTSAIFGDEHPPGNLGITHPFPGHVPTFVCFTAGETD